MIVHRYTCTKETSSWKEVLTDIFQRIEAGATFFRDGQRIGLRTTHKGGSHDSILYLVPLKEEEFGYFLYYAAGSYKPGLSVRIIDYCIKKFFLMCIADWKDITPREDEGIVNVDRETFITAVAAALEAHTSIKTAILHAIR